MILPILSFFLLLAGALVVFGYWQKESMYVLVGFSLLFVMGMQGMAEGGVDFQTGEVRTLDGNVTTIVYTYEPYTPESWFGFRPFFWLTMLGAFGFVLNMIDFNERYRRYQDEN